MGKLKEMLSEDEIKEYFQKAPLVPAIIQEAGSGQVLMMAYMNEESLNKTIETGYTWFYSRSRKELWNKGATSGNYQKVVSIYGDCDKDTLLVKVEQTGGACHTGAKSCFFNSMAVEENYEVRSNPAEVLTELYEVIRQRKNEAREGSYTAYLFAKGLDKILKKCGEECAEVIIAAKNNNNEELVNEICDLIYHLLVLIQNQGVTLNDVFSELDARRKKIGNLKQFHSVDMNT